MNLQMFICLFDPGKIDPLNIISALLNHLPEYERIKKTKGMIRAKH